MDKVFELSVSFLCWDNVRKLHSESEYREVECRHPYLQDWKIFQSFSEGSVLGLVSIFSHSSLGKPLSECCGTYQGALHNALGTSSERSAASPCPAGAAEFSGGPG